jgi:UDP-N-acetyl-2-amino-2-deoxyglucuronate dehydrogenase
VGAVLTTRIALVGCGFIGALHSRSLKALVDGGLVDARVTATCDTDPGRATAFARAHGAAVATDDPAEAVEASDAVWICTPTSSHLGLVELAAGAGRAVFCEKPLAPDLAGAEAIAAAVARAGVANQVGLVLRATPVFQAFRDVLVSGDLGRPMTVIFRDDQYFPTQGQYASTWRADVTIAGGGTLLEHSIHDLDILRWLLGDPVQVSGLTANYAGHRGVEDVAVATLLFASGATATLTSVWHRILRRATHRRLEAICEDGLVWTEDDRLGPIHVETDDGDRIVRPERRDWVAGLPVRDPQWLEWIADYAVAHFRLRRAWL